MDGPAVAVSNPPRRAVDSDFDTQFSVDAIQKDIGVSEKAKKAQRQPKRKGAPVADPRGGAPPGKKRKQDEKSIGEKKAALDSIDKYTQFFPEKFPGGPPDVTIDDDLEVIQFELDKIRAAVGNANLLGSAKVALVAVCKTAEYATENLYNPLNLKLAGFGGVVQNNTDSEEMESCLKELLLKHGQTLGNVLEPEVRLCILVGGMMLTVHSANLQGELNRRRRLEEQRQQMMGTAHQPPSPPPIIHGDDTGDRQNLNIDIDKPEYSDL
jgi:hypothetical protein